MKWLEKDSGTFGLYYYLEHPKNPIISLSENKKFFVLEYTLLDCEFSNFRVKVNSDNNLISEIKLLKKYFEIREL